MTRQPGCCSRSSPQRNLPPAAWVLVGVGLGVGVGGVGWGGVGWGGVEGGGKQFFIKNGVVVEQWVPGAWDVLVVLPAARLTVAVAAQPHQVAFGAAHNRVEQVVAVVTLRLHAGRQAGGGGWVGRDAEQLLLRQGGTQGGHTGMVTVGEWPRQPYKARPTTRPVQACEGWVCKYTARGCLRVGGTPRQQSSA